MWASFLVDVSTSFIIYQAWVLAVAIPFQTQTQQHVLTVPIFMEDGTDWATATIYIAVAMALTSPFKHIALSAAVSWHQQNQLH